MPLEMTEAYIPVEANTGSLGRVADSGEVSMGLTSETVEGRASLLGLPQVHDQFWHQAVTSRSHLEIEKPRGRAPEASIE